MSFARNRIEKYVRMRCPWVRNANYAELDRTSSFGKRESALMEAHLSLTIESSAEHTPWLSRRLTELGFAAFEERASETGIRLIVYDPSERRLRDVQRQLEQSARQRSPRPQLQFEIGQATTDWALSWTQHLQPVQLTAHLTLFPQLPTRAPGPSEIYLEPAFAFGFGEHPSTRLIARWLEHACMRHEGCSVLDVGSGTGVLALVAHKHGAGRVVGVDLSEPAVQAARDNAEHNRASGLVFLQVPVSQLVERFDRVVANIEANVLLDLCDDIVARLSPAGELALAGLIEEQCDAVMRRYYEGGVLLEIEDREDDWCLLVGRRRPGA